ncbi:MAG: tRNA (cytidine(34)-2'-O)-methyltransferase [Erysipelotrichaceae bacterium]
MIHIVLYQPEIPQNTGNIMRTCVATGSKLHLIKPLGFSLDENKIRRSGMDYREHLDMQVYDNFDCFLEQNKGCFCFITRYGNKPPSSMDFKDEEEVYLIFGKESTGIPKEILRMYPEHLARLPMVKDARSLNLSNCVAICTYEVLRQKDYNGLSSEEFIKGNDWLFKD